MAELVIKLVNGELAGKTMQQITKEVSAAALALKKAEIGTEDWVKAHAKLEKAKGLQADMRKQIDATASASDALKAAWNRLPGSQFFNQIGESFGLMKNGVGGLVTQFGVLKTAIAATGLGLLVIVLGSLFTWFTKTEEGADKLKSVLYPLQVLFQKMTGIVAELGGKVFKQFSQALTDPMQAIKDLGKAIYDNIINRFEALGKFAPAIVKIFKGDILGGFKDLGNAQIQLVTGIENGIDKIQSIGKKVAEVWEHAYEEGQQLLVLENAIEDAEADLVKQRALLNVELQKQMELAKDVTKSDAERHAAAKRVMEIQDRLSNAEENFLRLRLRLLKLKQEEDGIINDDEKLERAKLEADLIQLQADNIQKKMKAAGIAHQIEKEQQEEREKWLLKELEAELNIQELKIEAMTDGLEKEIEQINFETSEKIAALTGSADQIREQEVLLEEIRNSEIQAVRDKYREQEKEKADKHAEELKDIREKLADAEAAIEDVRMDTFRGGVAGLGELLGEQIKNEKEARRVRKMFAIADIGIGLAQELAANSAAGAKISGQAPPWTVPAGIAYTTTANLRSYIRAGIATAKVLLFKKGGYTGEGADDEPAGIVHKNEYVVPAHITQNPKYKGLIGTLEGARLRGYQTGGPVSPFQDRAPVPSVAAANQTSGTIGPDSLERLEKYLIANFEAVNNRIDRIKVHNVVTETADGIKTINSIKAEADV